MTERLTDEELRHAIRSAAEPLREDEIEEIDRCLYGKRGAISGVSDADIARRLHAEVERLHDELADATAGLIVSDAPDPLVCVQEEVADRVEAECLRSEIRRLPSRERQVVALHYGLVGGEMSLREVARSMGISLGATHKLERRAIELLREAYAPEDEALVPGCRHSPVEVNT